MADPVQDRTDEAPPKCPLRTLRCGRYEVETEPPAVPRIWACSNPDCDLAIRAYGADDE